MNQSWKSWSCKLTVGIAIATSGTIVSSGYYALAQNTIKPIELAKTQTVNFKTIPGDCGIGICRKQLLLTSLIAHTTVNNPQSDQIFVNVQGVLHGPYTINPGNEFPINILLTSDYIVTVELFYQNSNNTKTSIGRQMIFITSSAPEGSLEFKGIGNGAHYTLLYRDFKW